MTSFLLTARRAVFIFQVAAHWNLMTPGIFLRRDQLTVARARSTQALRASHERPADTLEGIIPVCEHRHSRITLIMRVLSNE